MAPNETLNRSDPPSAPPLKAGDRFRGLLIHGRLGEGGMGTAWLASHPVLRTPLIVKTFSRSAAVPDFSEAQLAARVVSPFVVAVLDAGTRTGCRSSSSSTWTG